MIRHSHGSCKLHLLSPSFLRMPPQFQCLACQAVTYQINKHLELGISGLLAALCVLFLRKAPFCELSLVPSSWLELQGRCPKCQWSCAEHARYTFVIIPLGSQTWSSRACLWFVQCSFLIQGIRFCSANPTVSRRSGISDYIAARREDNFKK